MKPSEHYYLSHATFPYPTISSFVPVLCTVDFWLSGSIFGCLVFCYSVAIPFLKLMMVTSADRCLHATRKSEQRTCPVYMNTLVVVEQQLLAFPRRRSAAANRSKKCRRARRARLAAFTISRHKTRSRKVLGSLSLVAYVDSVVKVPQSTWVHCSIFTVG
jgi:hypothetical protein